MSIVLQGSTSGSITLQEPAVAGSTTIDLPATSGTALVAPTALTVPNTTGTVMVSGNMPAFHAYLANYQSGFSLSTWTKINLDSESFDTNSNFNTSTYRFTPTVAGYYQFNAIASCNATVTNPTGGGVAIYKNGSGYTSSVVQTTTNQGPNFCVSSLIYMNGSTDYVELYGIVYGGSGPAFNAGSTGTSLNGVLIRAA